MAGDFNLPAIDWDTLLINSTDFKNSEILFEIAFTHDLTQCVREATRVGTTFESVLDLVFLDSRLSECDVEINDGLSDHKLVLVCIKGALSARVGKRPTFTYRNFSRVMMSTFLIA